MYYQGTVGCLLVYDTTREETFQAVNSKWLKDFKQYVKKEGAYVLIGNKVDLKDERIISTEQGKEFSEQIGASDFVETSAKHGDNVEQAFIKLVHQILRNYGETV